MDLSRFLDVVRNSGWQGMALGCAAGPGCLWVGLVRCTGRAPRRSPWEECVGKIARPFLRKLNGEDEIAELKVIATRPWWTSSSPAFRRSQVELFLRCCCCVEGQRRSSSYWIRWGHLLHRLRRRGLVPAGLEARHRHRGAQTHALRPSPAVGLARLRHVDRLEPRAVARQPGARAASASSPQAGRIEERVVRTVRGRPSGAS